MEETSSTIQQNSSNNKKSQRLINFIFYLTIIIFFISFNFKNTPPPFGWYQQVLPNLNGRSITDIFFLDSLKGWGVTNATNQQNDTIYVLKTTNGGDNWIIQYRNLLNGGGFWGYTKIYFLNQYTGFASDITGISKTTNGGTNWFYLFPQNDYSVTDISILNEDTIWIVGCNGFYDAVLRTTNGGVNWQEQYGWGSLQDARIYMFNSRIGFIANKYFPRSNNLRKTTNSGQNWFYVNADCFTKMYFIDSLTGWKCAGSYDDDSTMKKTTDGGLTWNKETFNHGGYWTSWGISKFSNINKDTIWAVGGWVTFPNNHIWPVLWRTVNGGNNWAMQVPDTSLIHYQGSYAYISFVNKYNGWAYPYGFNIGIHTVTGGDTTFYTGVIQKSSNIPNQFVLKQNYPNPFNPRTVIGYELKKAGDIKIKVYSITGSEVFTLVNQRQTAGVYEVDMPGIGLSSGVYFYSLLVDNQRIDVKKMILLK